MNTYVVEGGIGKCTAFTGLIPKLRKKSEVQIYTPYIQCFANNPDVKLVLEQSLPIQDPRIMASDNIYYCEPYKSNFQFGKQHIIESYCKLHDVEFDVNMKPKLYTGHLQENVKKWLDKNNIEKYILVQFSGGQSPLTYQSGDDHAQSTAFQDLAAYGDSDNADDSCLTGTLQIFNPSSTTFVKNFIARTNYVANNYYSVDSYTSGYFNNTNNLDAIRFQMTSGTFNGVIKLYGIS